ncbi:MAG: SurA N-terminal domain-containing protein [Treponemataceae bacterium]
MKRLYIVFFAILGTLAFAQNDFQIIAEVNYSKKEPIALGTLKTYVKNFESQAGRDLTVAERRTVLDSLIDNRLVLQLAQKEGIKIPDSAVNERFQMQLSQIIRQPVTESQFETAIKGQGFSSLDDFMKKEIGMSVSQYKEFLRENITVQTYIGQKYGSEIQKVDATKAEIEQYYDVSKQNLIRPDMVTAFLVAVEKKGQTASEKAKIDALRARLVANPKSTAQIQKEAAQENSGFLAMTLYLAKNEQTAQSLNISMPQLLEIFSLKIGTVTDVTEMNNNFQFFVILGNEKMKFLTLDDKLDPSHDVTVREYIRMNIKMLKQGQAAQEFVSKVVSSIKNNKTFKITKSEKDLERLLAW